MKDAHGTGLAKCIQAFMFNWIMRASNSLAIIDAGLCLSIPNALINDMTGRSAQSAVKIKLEHSLGACVAFKGVNRLAETLNGKWSSSSLKVSSDGPRI